MDSSSSSSEESSGDDNDSESPTSSTKEHIKDHWEWNDKEQVHLREIERINVNDPDSRRRVTDARLSGVPVCLVGHTGWPQFVSRWLKLKGAPTSPSETKAHASIIDTTEENLLPPASGAPAKSSIIGKETTIASPDAQSGSSHKEKLEEDEDVNQTDKGLLPTEIDKSDTACETDKIKEPVNWLDLGNEWEIDVDKMIDDIGDELVPVIRKGYDERNPIHNHVPLQSFLKKSWPSNDSADATGKSIQRLYLHQWQFPLSDSDAASKLCGEGNNNPLPNDILGEDLLAYWLNPETCNGDNPFQYLFMGREETMSKLHRDPGGLAISIAPIVGKKEVVLVHRADGNSCLYHLKANLNRVDLHKYPMLSHARIYKSIINPGEILLMPQGTFHQCRNVTPCLSYSRFHLDTVNLRAFFESMINQDAPEIEHDDVIWNAACELQKKVDACVDEAKGMPREATPAATMEVAPDVVRKVEALRALRTICREIGKRYEEGKLDVNRQPPGLGTSEDPSGPGIESRRSVSESSPADNEEEAIRWSDLLRDMDSTLHDFRYRCHKVKPQFQSRSAPRIRGKSTSQSSERYGAQPSETTRRAPLEVGLANLPTVVASTPCLSESVSLTIGNEVEVKWQGHRAQGMIKQIEVDMSAARVDYEDLPPAFSEYVPLGYLRLPVSGECNTEVSPKDVVPGKVLVHRHGREVCDFYLYFLLCVRL